MGLVANEPHHSFVGRGKLKNSVNERCKTLMHNKVLLENRIILLVKSQVDINAELKNDLHGSISSDLYRKHKFVMPVQ